MSTKTVLITGASSGIGMAVAKEFVKYGCKVYGTERLNENVSIPGIEILKLEVTDKESIKNCLQTIIQKEGKIDILVNNAGFALMGPVAEVAMKDVELEFNVNFMGVLSMIQQAVPYMVKAGSGMIVNVSSITAVLTTAFAGIYGASKSAVNAMSEALRIELKPFNIKVVIVQPGTIRSDLGKVATGFLGGYRENSIYSSISEFIEKRAMYSQVNSTPAEVFARKFVRKLMKKNPPSLIRIGKTSFIMPLLRRILPLKIREQMIAKKFGLTKIKLT